MTTSKSISQTKIEGLQLVHQGKVRDVYQVDEARFLLVATDRISAFDCISPTPIPRKGEILTQLSAFWFKRFSQLIGHHLITSDFDEMPAGIKQHEELRGRSTLVKKTKVFPVECVVRGYLAGSGWKDYKKIGAICGIPLPEGLQEAAKLPGGAIFTPSTKAVAGAHDENIPFSEVEKLLGRELAAQVRDKAVALYTEAADYAIAKGIIIADTKFEFGQDDAGRLYLIDEALTPDSSRFWPTDQYAPGKNPPSYDKQFVRDWLETLDWNKKAPAPALPPAILAKTTEKYKDALRRLSG